MPNARTGSNEALDEDKLKVTSFQSSFEWCEASGNAIFTLGDHSTCSLLYKIVITIWNPLLPNVQFTRLLYILCSNISTGEGSYFLPSLLKKNVNIRLLGTRKNDEIY